MHGLRIFLHWKNKNNINTFAKFLITFALYNSNAVVLYFVRLHFWKSLCKE